MIVSLYNIFKSESLIYYTLLTNRIAKNKNKIIDGMSRK